MCYFVDPMDQCLSVCLISCTTISPPISCFAHSSEVLDGDAVALCRGPFVVFDCLVPVRLHVQSLFVEPSHIVERLSKVHLGGLRVAPERLSEVHLAAETVLVGPAECSPGVGLIPHLCRPFGPMQGQRLVLLHAHRVAIAEAQVVHGCGVAGVGARLIPVDGHRQIHLHTVQALLVVEAQVVHRTPETGLGRLAIPLGALQPVCAAGRHS
mmetsp:Transcript_9596/g.24054  ORF Transcript_9596/g.24054 Transcript_9596/m.24054 type:complete len:211 (-) Transcript_9596:927-1559(-)